jgi:ArsR family transcriptional regulator
LGTLFAQILLNLFRKAELSRIAMENRFVEKATGAISDKYRLAILLELSNKGSMTSSDIQELTGLSQPCVSHHVKLLTDSGLVNAQKEGRNLHLTLNKESLQQLSGFIEKLT